jgi:hypothetical protein
VRRFTTEEQAEREIDRIVYKLFDLTPDEVALLEGSLAGNIRRFACLREPPRQLSRSPHRPPP